MSSRRPAAAYDRVSERRRAVALARHFREAEGLSIVQIAARLGRSPATIQAYFYDPTGEKARAVKPRYQGVPRLRRLHSGFWAGLIEVPRRPAVGHVAPVFLGPRPRCGRQSQVPLGFRTPSHLIAS
jgi:hypothetical protein